MKLNLSQFWFSCKDEEANTFGEDYVSSKHFERQILTSLQKDGYIVPTRRTCKTLLESEEDLFGPLPSVDTDRHKGINVMSFVHFVHLMWLPILRWVSNLGAGAPGSQTKTENLTKHFAALKSEMIGKVPSPDTELTMDDWVSYMHETLLKILEVEVPRDLILHVVSPMQFDIELTRANAVHFLRTELCCKLVGCTMAKQVSRTLLETLTGMPIPNKPSKEQLTLDIKKDLVHTLQEIHGPPREEVEDDEEPVQKKRRGKQAEEENMAHKTKQVVYMIKNRISGNRMHATVIGAGHLLQDLLQNSTTQTENLAQATEKVEDILVSRHNLQRHLLLLDGAMDRLTADRIMELREAKRFSGVAIATDESPPSQPRFRGLRFQISVFYYGAFPPVAEWGTMQAPPLTLHTALADICHCPGKKGTDVSRVLERQLARLGMNPFDVVSCTGDGGGENEGLTGIHSHFENLNPGYVRRRCLPHIAWRSADQALEEAGLDYKSLASYLAEGITWSRLRVLAVQPRAAGGLGLFRDGSQDRSGHSNRWGAPPFPPPIGPPIAHPCIETLTLIF